MLFSPAVTAYVRVAKIVTALLIVVPVPIVQAAVSQLEVRPIAPTERDTLNIDVRFDAPVCAPNPDPALPRSAAVTTSAIVQSRVEGQTISVVLSATPAFTGCTATSLLTFALPPLAAGTYSLRVAGSTIGFSGTIYANRTIGSSMSTTVVVAPDLPPVVGVYLDGTGTATALGTEDLGTYQYYPHYASDTGRWQPAFQAWARRTPEPNSQLRPVYALASRIAGLTERLFYTVDTKERAGLLASGAFVDAAPSVASFAAMAPIAGICPAGRPGVFRAYDPQTKIHRYVPQSTYRMLLANGWDGDGIAFCVAAELANQSSWAPN